MPTPPIQTVAVRHYLVMRDSDPSDMDYARLRLFIQKVLDALCGEPSRILVDGRSTPSTYTFAEAYRLVEEFKHVPCIRTGRVAILGEYDESFERTQSLEAFAQEAGLAVKAFLEYEKAAEWLTSHTPARDLADLA